MEYVQRFCIRLQTGHLNERHIPFNFTPLLRLETARRSAESPLGSSSSVSSAAAAAAAPAGAAGAVDSTRGQLLEALVAMPFLEQKE